MTASPDAIDIEVDGQRMRVPVGANLGAMLHQHFAGHLRDTASGAPRGLFCGMGVCFDCVALVDCVPTRTCLTTVAPGMVVRRQMRATS
ncbi:2Fe-2S iron-sulfur cluster-binding protein [Ancylobacter terrae]|uniref:2Fe-2S iron-sulfur cluster-binding protein n=1 Tax=Ancylobacter sp. sgz301288 TaxID=3342077 RepID=UPI00385FACAB